MRLLTTTTKKSVVNFLKGVASGAVTGEAISHIADNVTNKVDPALARDVTKAVSGAVSSVAVSRRANGTSIQALLGNNNNTRQP